MLFRFGTHNAPRLCITEAAIDARSLAAFEEVREGNQYLSTGGGSFVTTDTQRYADLRLFRGPTYL